MSAVRKYLPAGPEIREPLLRLVDRAAMRTGANRRFTVTMACAAIVVTLFAVALAQARLVESQQEIDVLNAKIVKIESERARLARDVVVAEAPDRIITRARDLGMVDALAPVYLEGVRSPALAVEGNAVNSDADSSVAVENSGDSAGDLAGEQSVVGE